MQEAWLEYLAEPEVRVAFLGGLGALWALAAWLADRRVMARLPEPIRKESWIVWGLVSVVVGFFVGHIIPGVAPKELLPYLGAGSASLAILPARKERGKP